MQLPGAAIKHHTAERILHVHVGVAQFLEDQHAGTHALTQRPELFGRKPLRAIAVELWQPQHIAGLTKGRVEFDDAFVRNFVGDRKFLSDFTCAGTFSTAGLADDERYDFVRGLELLEDGGFQVGEFHDDRLTCRLLVSDIVKPYASISDVYEYSRFVRKTYGIDGSENKKRGRSKDRP